MENVAYPLRVNGWRRKDAAARAREYVELTGLSHAVDKYPHELSGGMKQRVAIARALALEPVILLMDEPFGSLDAITRARLQRELRGILERTETTLFFVTHSIDEALILGERVVVLHGHPSTVREIVDVRDVGEPDSPATPRCASTCANYSQSKEMTMSTTGIAVPRPRFAVRLGTATRRAALCAHRRGLIGIWQAYWVIKDPSPLLFAGRARSLRRSGTAGGRATWRGRRGRPSRSSPSGSGSAPSSR